MIANHLSFFFHSQAVHDSFARTWRPFPLTLHARETWEGRGLGLSHDSSVMVAELRGKISKTDQYAFERERHGNICARDPGTLEQGADIHNLADLTLDSTACSRALLFEMRSEHRRIVRPRTILLSKLSSGD